MSTKRRRTRTAARLCHATVVATLLVGCQREASEDARWWRTPFPPAAVAAPVAQPRFDPARVVPGIGYGSVDGAHREGDGSIFLWGWAFDLRSDTRVDAVLLFDGDDPEPRLVHVFRDRPDVAEFRRKPELLPTGWNLWIPAEAPRRAHRYRGYAVLADGAFGALAGEADLPAEVSLP